MNWKFKALLGWIFTTILELICLIEVIKAYGRHDDSALVITLAMQFVVMMMQFMILRFERSHKNDEDHYDQGDA